MTVDDAAYRRLMEAAQAGDRAAYAVLLRECQIWLRRYFAGRVPPVQLDDLVQETMLSLHLKRATYDPARPFLPWLAAIARYRWVDHLRRVYRSREMALDDEAELMSEDEPGAATARLGLAGMLRQLPEKQAEAIRLTKIEELSTAEASAQSGQSAALIKVNVHRGLKRLQRLIERE